MNNDKDNAVLLPLQEKFTSAVLFGELRNVRMDKLSGKDVANIYRWFEREFTRTPPEPPADAVERATKHFEQSGFMPYLDKDDAVAMLTTFAKAETADLRKALAELVEAVDAVPVRFHEFQPDRNSLCLECGWSVSNGRHAPALAAARALLEK